MNKIKSYNNRVLANAAYRELRGVDISIEDSLSMNQGAELRELREGCDEMRKTINKIRTTESLTPRMESKHPLMNSLKKQYRILLDRKNKVQKRFDFWGLRNAL